MHTLRKYRPNPLDGGKSDECGQPAQRRGGATLARTGTDGFHPPIEEYLKVIYELEEEGVPVIRARLAERLGHSPPTVTEMVTRLIDDGYLKADSRLLQMTIEGHSQAETVVRRHRLAERLLVDIIGIDWYKAHKEADRWEHVISDEVEPLLVGLLHNPQSCPHGNPIPGSGGAQLDLRSLSTVKPGDRIRLRRIAECVETDLEMLIYLDTHGFRPGAVADVSDRSPDGTLTLNVNGEMIALTETMSANLYVDAP